MFGAKNLKVTTSIDALVGKFMRFEESIAVPYGSYPSVRTTSSR